MWVRALSGPALVAVVLGAAISVMCTGMITPALWFGSAVCWAFVPAAQAVTGLVFFRRGRLSVPAFLEALFSTHRPWSLWYLAVAGVVLVWPRVPSVLFESTALVPLALTIRLLLRLSVQVLGIDRRTAIRRVAAHQAATVGLIVVTQLQSLVPRVIGLLQP